MNYKIVTTQYPLQVLDNWEAYKQKIMFYVRQAKEQRADILMFPEYAGLEVAWFEKASLNKQWDKLQNHIPQYLEFFSKLAKDFNLYLQPGTIPIKNSTGKFNNRAHFFSPTGNYDYQDKMVITESEGSISLISAGDTLKVFDTIYGKIGIAICYDSEFSPLINLLAYQHGVTTILVPSYTDTLHGFYRVHLCCRARAVEYQCYMVQACAHNGVDVCEFLDGIPIGNAGIFAPPDDGFPENGVLALGNDTSNSQFVSATLSLEKLMHVRKNGQVRNFSDQALLDKILPNVKITQTRL